MSLSVLICDDSPLARKAIARALPEDWDITISFAEQGELGIEAIKAGKGELVFLDLNMPVMDGYQVLEKIQKENLEALVIVISGDIQPEAHKKVRALGALDFIQKPIDQTNLLKLLKTYGLYEHSEIAPQKQTYDAIETGHIELREALQEVSNIAMGRAGDLLARLLDVFVLLPIPNVNTLASSELHMALSSIANNDNVSAVSQGFISSGINGEALIIFHDSSFADIAKLLKYEEELTNNIEIELMNDISNILIGAFLNGLAEQLDIQFSQGQPCVLGQHCQVEDLIQERQTHWKKTLAIEVNYRIEHHDIKCDLLLLFTEDSIKTLTHKIGYLID
ncbi:response regulator receiver protein [Psychromonas sp. CNPT3]|uniref:response regulator n=1 Tax=Psychromonas sp. CNPT3 TaxID=314282 RepID=UPI00006E85BF|nr:response regulator [Psychromonas sp. CNPT3]AGH81407.1 response regulator receiver protein [Psychromonas sp. CNPT3]